MGSDTPKPFRAGDHVHHAPSGEDWVLACDQEGDEVAPAGWPESYALDDDCTLIRAASDDERMDMLRRVAKHPDNGRRASWARRQLAALEATNGK